MKSTVKICVGILVFCFCVNIGAGADAVRIGNYLREAANGIAWIIDDRAAFVVNPEHGFDEHHYTPSIAAPDGSYHRSQFINDGAQIVLEWGRIGNSVVGRITADRNTTLNLRLSAGWPGWEANFSGVPDGATGTAQANGKLVHWAFKLLPLPILTTASNICVSLSSNQPVRFVAGVDVRLPEMGSVNGALQTALANYQARQPQAAGDWGDFIGAIADNVNNSRLYSSDNQVLAHCVSRDWSGTPNGHPYFCWDSFLTANLAAIDDPVTARNTVRAILSCQTAEGLVPNFGHWGDRLTEQVSVDRSQPPVGSWCVWKMHQRYPDDLDFLREVYPKLVRWHDWWHQGRDAKRDGLLEWGSATGGFQEAQWETGWDDNLHFADAEMVGNTMNSYAVDLCSLWAQDAHYLALLADALGKVEDARRFRADEATMNQRINEKLWNAELQTYCSRYLDDATARQRVGPSAFAPGFEGEYFNDEELKGHATNAHAATLDFKWRGRSPVKGVGATHWSSRWRGAMTAPVAGTYRFTATADDGVRVFIDGQRVINRWSANKGTQSADLKLEQGQKVQIIVEYFQHEKSSELHLDVNRVEPANGRFLTRLTPMNLYPLICGAPAGERAEAVLSLLTNPKKFWGKYLLPTLTYDDPDWHLQNYWRGHVWGPVNYIVFDGIKRYATPEQVAEYADRNVELFMQNWTTERLCGENYLSTTGHQDCDPHYTWGALLCLVGLESIVDVDDQGRIVLNGAQTKRITLTNIPLLGQRFDVQTEPGSATLIHAGKVVGQAKGVVIRLTPPRAEASSELIEKTSPKN